MKQGFFTIICLTALLLKSVAPCLAEEKEEEPPKENAVLAEIKSLWSKADAGDSEARIMVGTAYFLRNQGVYDHVQTTRWFRWAADKGDFDAMYNLGQMYATGQGVSQDVVRAHMWYSLSASSAEIDSDVKRAFAARDRLVGKLSPSQLAEAQRLARERKSD